MHFRCTALPVLLLAAAFLLLTAGCDTGPEAGDTSGFLPGKAFAGPADHVDERLVQGNTTFGFSIFRALCEKDPHGNIFISPAGISMALAMTSNGAAGETLQEMLGTLRLQEMGLDEMNRAFANLKSILENPDPGVELVLANSIWARRDVDFNEDFLQRNRDHFTAEIGALDFDAPDAAPAINRWVEQQTRGKIDKIVDAPIDPLTVLFLINALYFNGAWSDEFDPELTREMPFRLPGGTEKNHPTMFREGRYAYFQGEGFEAVRIPYGENRRIVMTLFLPSPESSLMDFYRELTPGNWASWQLSFGEMPGEIGLPRFKFEYEVSLNELLRELGMERAFDPRRADFSGMHPAPPEIYISGVKHKTYVDVSEKGTEAAAVTSVECVATSVQLDRFSMIVDRPFFFTINDEKTGTILFMGAVNEP